VAASNAYIGLAPLGEAGSWQRENKVRLINYIIYKKN